MNGTNLHPRDTSGFFCLALPHQVLFRWQALEQWLLPGAVFHTEVSSSLPKILKSSSSNSRQSDCNSTCTPCPCCKLLVLSPGPGAGTVKAMSWSCAGSNPSPIPIPSQFSGCCYKQQQCPLSEFWVFNCNFQTFSIPPPPGAPARTRHLQPPSTQILQF